ncbi:MAG: NAD(P)-dependent oxidoreductase [Candidatus Accumulibacter sp. UW20]|jgi:nucleoside-diphosphate-sugar epimerase
MRVAITGASGFVGRHVLNALSAHDLEIVAVTREADRLAGVQPSVQVVEMDIGESGINAFAKLGSPEVLIHLAWDGLPNYRSLHHFESELPRQYRFLKNLIESGLPSILVAGTCFEYGLQSGPLAADTRTLPDNPYGYAKDALRKQLQFLQSMTHFHLTWARLFYMFGEGQPSSCLYPKLREAVYRGDSMFNMSGGEQLRDYLRVEEVARQIVHLALARQDVGIVNICSGNPVSVRKIVEEWLRENSWEIKLNLGYYPYPDYEPMAFWGKGTPFDLIPEHR